MVLIPSTNATITVGDVGTILGNTNKNMSEFRGFGGSVPSIGAISMSDCQKIKNGVGYYNSWQTNPGVSTNWGSWSSTSITTNSSMTCSIWFKSSAIYGNWRNMFHVAASGGPDAPRYPSYYLESGGVRILQSSEGGGGYYTSAVNHTGQTYHLLITYNGSTVKTYLNGSLDRTDTFTISNGGTDVYGPDATYPNFANGSLNYLWFFPYPMTDTQVSTYYNSLASTLAPGLQNYVLTISPVTTSSYTGTTPSFGTSFVTFTNASSQYIDWGTRTLNLGTSGFSAKLKIAWSGYNNWARIFDFNSGASGNADMFLALYQTQSSPLRFMYKESGSEQITDCNATISLNTVYNISVVYNPTIGSTGRVQIWVNGSVVVTNTGMALRGTDKSYTYTYVGKSSYAVDAYLGANIYFLNVYNRALTDAEAAATY